MTLCIVSVIADVGSSASAKSIKASAEAAVVAEGSSAVCMVCWKGAALVGVVIAAGSDCKISGVGGVAGEEKRPPLSDEGVEGDATAAAVDGG